MERICLDCNTPIKGRTDKKFCDDLCRSNYNNRLKADDQSFVRLVNQTLKKNREILKAKHTAGKVKIDRETLIKQGFDFTFHTHSYTTTNGSTYFFCYEYGYLALKIDEFLLIKR